MCEDVPSTNACVSPGRARTDPGRAGTEVTRLVTRAGLRAGGRWSPPGGAVSARRVRRETYTLQKKKPAATHPRDPQGRGGRQLSVSVSASVSKRVSKAERGRGRGDARGRRGCPGRPSWPSSRSDADRTHRIIIINKNTRRGGVRREGRGAPSTWMSASNLGSIRAAPPAARRPAAPGPARRPRCNAAARGMRGSPPRCARPAGRGAGERAGTLGRRGDGAVAHEGGWALGVRWWREMLQE